MVVFVRLSEARAQNPGHAVTKASLGPGLRRVHSLSSMKAEVQAASEGHQQYGCTRPHKTWLDASCPVSVDLGLDWLARRETDDGSGFPGVRLVAKRKLIDGAMTQTRAVDVASHPGSPRDAVRPTATDRRPW